MAHFAALRHQAHGAGAPVEAGFEDILGALSDDLNTPGSTATYR